MDEYEPGSEDWRITLKAFGDLEDRRVFAFVGRSQMSPVGDRDLTTEEFREDMGKDVTSCVDFKGDFPKHIYNFQIILLIGLLSQSSRYTLGRILMD